MFQSLSCIQNTAWNMKVGWCLTALSAQINYIMRCPSRKLILQHAYSKTEPGFKIRCFHCPSKYCNHSATEAVIEYDGKLYVNLSPGPHQLGGGGGAVLIAVVFPQQVRIAQCIMFNVHSCKYFKNNK